MGALLAETSLDMEQRDYLETIRVSSDQLLAVINDVLDFSKIESGKLDLEQEVFSVRSTVEEACDIAAPRARDKGLELLIDIRQQEGDENNPRAVPEAIAGDVTRLRQVLINLINNAVKFTDRGEVVVHVRRLEGDQSADGRIKLEFRISDTGIGIAPERANDLFDAFTQADVSTTRKYGGTGLGLAICKRLVHLMGGEIGVESTPGKGATSWFTLPAMPGQMAPAVTTLQAGLLRGRKVLVVDDHATNVRILLRQLALWGIDAPSAESGIEALQWMEAQVKPPDIIITDMHMPGMDGITFARTVQEEKAWRDIPVILLSSGFMPSGDENASLFKARLLKPARQSQLFEVLVRCISPHVEEAHTARRAQDVRRNATVLIADDNAINLKVAGAMVQRLGYDVVTANDGQEAVEKVASLYTAGERLFAVLMDISMPRLDGIQATKQILGRWGDESPPIIALTAAASPEDRMRCLEAGMLDYLTKPLQVAALAAVLEKQVVVGGAGDPGVAASDGPGAPASEAPLVDFARLAEFREFDDAELSMTREVIQMFEQDMPVRLAAMEHAIAVQDAAALEVAAHALKGACGNVGARAMLELCTEIESGAQTGTIPANAAAQIRELKSLVPGSLSTLAAWLPPAA